MAKSKSKPKKKPSKNHFKPGDPDGIVCLGTLKGVVTEINEVRDEANEIKLVGERRPGNYGGPKTVTVEGEDLKVFTTDKGVFFVPPCGDQGYGITRETFDAMVKAVQEFNEK